MPIDPTWTSEQLAKELCDELVAKGHLKEKPAFIRTDREAKIAGIFVQMGLDGAKMDTFDNPGPLEMTIRRGTQGEVWVEQVIASLVSFLPKEKQEAEKKMEMDEDTKQEMRDAQDKTSGRRAMQDDRDGRGGGGGGGKGGRDEECYNCQGYGHLARDCPEPRRPKGGGRDRDDRGGGGGYGGGGGGRGRDDDQECYNCNGFGHISRDCPEPKRGKGGGGGGGFRDRDDDRGGGGGRGGDQGCFNCGGFGHISRDCPEPRKPKGGGKDRGGGGGGDQECYNCGGFGHISRDCPEPRKPKGGGRDDRD